MPNTCAGRKNAASTPYTNNCSDLLRVPCIIISVFSPRFPTANESVHGSTYDKYFDRCAKNQAGVDNFAFFTFFGVVPTGNSSSATFFLFFVFTFTGVLSARTSICDKPSIAFLFLFSFFFCVGIGVCSPSSGSSWSRSTDATGAVSKRGVSTCSSTSSVFPFSFFCFLEACNGFGFGTGACSGGGGSNSMTTSTCSAELARAPIGKNRCFSSSLG
jgi:hypothetical protein